jgi:hypothetical protein
VYSLRFCITPEAMVLVGYNSVGSSIPIRCIDTLSGKVRWSQRGWAIGTREFGSFTGPWHHDCDVVITPHKVFVFGHVTSEAYFGSARGLGKARVRAALHIYAPGKRSICAGS